MTVDTSLLYSGTHSHTNRRIDTGQTQDGESPLSCVIRADVQDRGEEKRRGGKEGVGLGGERGKTGNFPEHM